MLQCVLQHIPRVWNPSARIPRCTYVCVAECVLQCVLQRIPRVWNPSARMLRALGFRGSAVESALDARVLQ